MKGNRSDRINDNKGKYYMKKIQVKLYGKVMLTKLHR